MSTSVDAVAKVDATFLLILGISVVVLVLVTALMLFFVWRYHHSRHPEPEHAGESWWLEVVWTIIPTVLAVGMFWFGWDSYQALRAVPENALEVKVEAYMWGWNFEYENGRRSNILYVPQKTPIKLTMTSRDVLHSFYVPAFRLKRDTVPGMQTYAWFLPKEQGDYDILCAEYCGVKHANMLSTVRVVPEEKYESWLAGELDEEGKGDEALFETYGCTSCHSLDGSEGVGPTLYNIYGKTRILVLPDGTQKEQIADKAYLRRAILYPNEELVQGYEALMASYEGVIPEDELLRMVNWMANQGVGDASLGRQVAEDQGCLSCHSTDGSDVAGPSFRGLYGSMRVVVEDGAEKSVVADDAYIRDSILNPKKILTKGYGELMPAYDALSEEELLALIDWIKTLGVPPSK